MPPKIARSKRPPRADADPAAPIPDPSSPTDVPDEFGQKPYKALGTLSKESAYVLDILLKFRWDASKRERTPSPESIVIKAREIAAVYGCVPGHARRLIWQLADEYPKIRVKRHGSAGYLVTFAYSLAGDQSKRAQGARFDPPEDLKARGARGKGKGPGGAKARPAVEQSAPCAPSLPIRVLESRERENVDVDADDFSTSRGADGGTLARPAAPDPTAAEATPAPTPAASTARRETTAERRAAVKAWYFEQPEAWRDGYHARAAATVDRDFGRQFPGFILDGALELAEAEHRDRWPVLDERRTAIGPVPPPSAPSAPAVVAKLPAELEATAGRIAALGTKEGPAASAVYREVLAALHDLDFGPQQNRALRLAEARLIPGPLLADAFRSACAKPKAERGRAFGKKLIKSIYPAYGIGSASADRESRGKRRGARAPNPPPDPQTEKQDPKKTKKKHPPK